MYLEDRIEMINKRLTELEKKKNIVIWGASENTVRLLQYTSIFKYDITKIVDNKHIGKSFYGKIIASPKNVEWFKVGAVIISSFWGESEIEKELYEKYKYNGSVIKLNEKGQTSPFYNHLFKSELQAPENIQSILNKNRKFKNIHTGKRLFVLCCGPSIQKMNLTVLKDEITMAVHSFYLHKDIYDIQPKYYCNAQWGYNEKMTKELELQYIKELKRHVGKSQYFFSVMEKDLIEKSSIFQSEELNYYFYGINSFLYEDIDICQGIMPPQSVSILCLQLALYMGFKEIYLLGTEHDTLNSNYYKHFYSVSDSIISKESEETDEDGNLNDTFEHQLFCIYNLWEQYKVIKKIAEKNNIKIYNATLGGRLDLFERVDFKKMF